MMETDLYIKKRNKPKGCLGSALAVLILLIAGVTLWFIRQNNAAEQSQLESWNDMPVVTQSIESVSQPAASSIEQSGNHDNPDIASSPEAKSEPAISSTKNLIMEASLLRRQGDLLGARSSWLNALQQARNPQYVQQIENELAQLNIDLVFSAHDMPEKIAYTVQSGDTLNELAKKYGTTVDLIRKGNNIKGSIIRIGDYLRILNRPFAIEVRKQQNDLTLFLDGQFFKRYGVGTGKFGKTPTGKFVISDKIKNPPWWKNGKVIPYGHTNNVLGTHWMAIKSLDNPGIRGYGIHGTWQPETIGHQASEGCVRMLNEEVEELFTLVPIGTEVTIREE